MDSFNREILDQAIHYATEFGWAVLPLYGVGPDGKCACGNALCTSPAKHPATRNGLKDATRDPEKIREWFGAGKPLNLGVATGPVSGLAVLDVDFRADGDKSLRDLLDRPGPNPLITIGAHTGNGYHYYFRYPEDGLKNSAGKLGPGLDVRGDGGYVVAPPSVHANGQTYEFVLSFEELAEFPAPWLEALNGTAGISSGNGKTAPGPPEARDGGIYIPPPDVNLNPEAVGEGGRNNTLASMAGKLRYYGFGQGAIEAALLAENERVCLPPLDRSEVLRIARSIPSA